MNSHDDTNRTPCGEAPSYMLGALEPHEARRFLDHASDCAVCRDELTALAPAVDLLAESAVQVLAPKDLKRRVMSSVGADAATRNAVQRRSSPLAWLGALRLRPIALAGACGALAAVVAVLAISALGSSSNARVHSVSAEVTLPGAAATLHQSAGQTWLTVDHMPPAGNGRVYEVWIARAGQPRPTSALFSPTTRGEGIVAVPGKVSSGSEVLVTSEPAGGSLKPTRAAVIIARVS